MSKHVQVRGEACPSSIPKSPITPSKLEGPGRRRRPAPATRRLTRALQLEVENGKLKSAQCVWDSERTGVHAEARGRGAPGARCRGGMLRGSAGGERVLSRASTLDEDDDDVDEVDAWTAPENERLTSSTSPPRARIAEVERHWTADGENLVPGSDGKLDRHARGDARAPIEHEITTPPPPPPPSSHYRRVVPDARRVRRL